jgi:hypothetical protein
MVDGTPNTHAYQGTSAVPLSIALISDFKVYSGVAPAEFGQGGSQIRVIRKNPKSQAKPLGETGCATTASPLLLLVGQSLSPASDACGSFSQLRSEASL